MADLLGSIMSSMEKAQPKQAPADEKQRDLIKRKASMDLAVVALDRAIQSCRSEANSYYQV